MIADWHWLVFWTAWAVFMAVGYWRDSDHSLSAWFDSADEPTPIDEVHQLYLDGEIDEHEMEARLEVLVDDRAETIRELADDAEGIGEKLSRELAREFDSVAEFRGASAADLERRVDGVGEKRAARLKE